MLSEKEVRGWLRDRVEIPQDEVDQWMKACQALGISDLDDLTERIAAAERQPISPTRAVMRELLARGDYGSIRTIPYDEAAPVAAPTVGVLRRDLSLLLLYSPSGPSLVRSLGVAPEDEVGFFVAWAAQHGSGRDTPQEYLHPRHRARRPTT